MHRKVTIFNGFADPYEMVVEIVEGKAICPHSGVKAEIQEFSFGGTVTIGSLLQIEAKAKGASILFDSIIR